MSIDQQLQTRLDTARLNAVPVVELSSEIRPLLLAHLLALGPEDRYLRFGNPLSDQIIAQYVAHIDFNRDIVFAVFNTGLTLDAAGHFAPLPENDGSQVAQSAEFGLSVASSARGQGLGAALFVRAANHARNQGVHTLLMHCLTQNKAMMRIAQRSGMRISASYGEADAYLELAPADAASRVAEAMHEQIGLYDYAVKQQRSKFLRLWGLQQPAGVQ